MRYTDFLKTTVLLTAGEATALGAVTVAAASRRGDTTTIVFSLIWWAVATLVGAWIGRRTKPSEQIRALLASARTSRALPEMRPGAVLLNRLWPLGVSALIAAGISWLYPQVAGVATGCAILVALAWRKQESAVTAIEGRDGVQFYVIATSPFQAMTLVRIPGYSYPTANGDEPD